MSAGNSSEAGNLLVIPETKFAGARVRNEAVSAAAHRRVTQAQTRKQNQELRKCSSRECNVDVRADCGLRRRAEGVRAVYHTCVRRRRAVPSEGRHNRGAANSKDE